MAWNDETMDRALGELLRAGVVLAAVVVATGTVPYLHAHGADLQSYAVFHGEPRDLRRLGGIAADALSLRPRGIMQLGVLLLLATPVARVAFSVVAFAAERDRLYVGLTLAVLSILLYSIVGAYL